MSKGSCHCKNIEFTVDAPIEKVIECNCSHCSRKGFLLAFIPSEKVDIKTPKTPTSKYLFNKHKIVHEFCPECGVQCFATSTLDDGTEMTAVNVRTIEDIDTDKLTIEQVDGKNM